MYRDQADYSMGGRIENRRFSDRQFQITRRKIVTRRKKESETIAVAMSGGVDSSVAAALLVRKGFRVVGLTMRLFCYSDAGSPKSCCSLDSIDAARQAADRLGFPHYVVDCQADFREKVIGKFISEYSSGRTPNPCVECNRHVKFGTLLAKARRLGCRSLATGHYAKIVLRRGRRMLAAGADTTKDQSYFLWALRADQLSAAIFPLGGMRKEKVRSMAKEMGLASSGRPESQEVCFVDGGRYSEFLSRHVEPIPGHIVDTAGKVLGRHRGIYRYTVGQRGGLGVAAGKPIYVLEIDHERNRLVAGPDHMLYKDILFVREANWPTDRPRRAFRCQARIRHRHRPAPALVRPLAGGRAEVRFQAPQRAITPGQSVVFYREGLVLGGGIIESAG